MPKNDPSRQPYLGADVAKDTITFMDLLTGVTQTVENRYEVLVAHLEAYRERTLAVCEATGGYEDVFLRACLAVGLPVHRADGAKVAHFARSLTCAKTDRIDARALAIYGRDRDEDLARWVAPTPHREELTRLVSRRQQLVRIRQGERTRRVGPRGAGGAGDLVDESFEALAATLAAQIEAIDARMAHIIASTPALKEPVRILRTLPGLGDVSAPTLLVLMRELGHLTRREVTSLAGCAPHPKQSGKTDGRRRTGIGRRQTKALLFMAAMVAVRGDNPLAAFYKRLLENGKSKRCALTAVARKIIVIANARLAEHYAARARLAAA